MLKIGYRVRIMTAVFSLDREGEIIDQDGSLYLVDLGENRIWFREQELVLIDRIMGKTATLESQRVYLVTRFINEMFVGIGPGGIRDENLLFKLVDNEWKPFLSPTIDEMVAISCAFQEFDFILEMGFSYGHQRILNIVIDDV